MQNRKYEIFYPIFNNGGRRRGGDELKESAIGAF